MFSENYSYENLHSFSFSSGDVSLFLMTSYFVYYLTSNVYAYLSDKYQRFEQRYNQLEYN